MSKNTWTYFRFLATALFCSVLLLGNHSKIITNFLENTNLEHQHFSNLSSGNAQYTQYIASNGQISSLIEVDETELNESSFDADFYNFTHFQVHTAFTQQLTVFSKQFISKYVLHWFNVKTPLFTFFCVYRI